MCVLSGNESLHETLMRGGAFLNPPPYTALCMTTINIIFKTSRVCLYVRFRLAWSLKPFPCVFIRDT